MAVGELGGPMIGERHQAKAGYRYHVFAYFPCNAAGVRIAVRKTARGAERFATAFAKRNSVYVFWRVR